MCLYYYYSKRRSRKPSRGSPQPGAPRRGFRSKTPPPEGAAVASFTVHTHYATIRF